MNLLISLPVGILLILAVFFGLLRLNRGRSSNAALLTALLTMLVYGSIASVTWQGADVFAIHLAIYLITVYALAIITAQRRTDGKRARLHWAPMALVGFFLFVILVDSVFILLAQQGMSDAWVRRILPEPRSASEVHSVFPGVVSHDFREKHNQFNDYQAQRERQIERNWQVRLGWEQPAVAGQANRLLLKVTTAEGDAVLDATVRGRFLDRTDQRQDQTFEMQRTLDALYQAQLTLSRPGPWDLVLSIERGEAQHEVRATTTVEPNPD